MRTKSFLSFMHLFTPSGIILSLGSAVTFSGILTLIVFPFSVPLTNSVYVRSKSIRIFNRLYC